MFRHLLLIVFSSIFITVFYSGKIWAAQEGLPRNYYPYNPKWADIYIGASVASLADITANTAGNPEWGTLYNPMKLLRNYGFNFNVGIRPLEVIPFFRNVRIEGEWQYRESRYNILQDTNKNAWLDKNKIPPYGKVYLKSAAVLNGYYDFRWISDIIYPYVGAGVGIGNVGIRAIDFTVLPNGIGEQYTGNKKNVPITQFMLGVQYDTKIIKTSVFAEYRFTVSGSLVAHPTYYGDEGAAQEGGDNENAPPPLPEGFTKPGAKNFSFKAHAIIFGVKYYLY